MSPDLWYIPYEQQVQVMNTDTDQLSPKVNGRLIHHSRAPDYISAGNDDAESIQGVAWMGAHFRGVIMKGLIHNITNNSLQ